MNVLNVITILMFVFDICLLLSFITDVRLRSIVNKQHLKNKND